MHMAHKLLRALGWPVIMAGSMAGVYFAFDAGVSDVLILAFAGVVGLLAARGLESVLPLIGGPRDRVADRADRLNLLLTEFSAQGAFRGLVLVLSTLAGVSLASRPDTGLWQLVGLNQLPWVAELAVAMVLLDLPLYWQHRLMHTRPGLWSVHAVHHSSRRLAAITGIRNHVLSPLMTATVSLGFAWLAPSPDVFLAAHVWIIVKGWLQHADVDLRTPGFDWLFPTPRAHRFHHSRKADESASNFGILTLVWDHVPWHRLPVVGAHMSLQRRTFYMPSSRLAPVAYGCELADRAPCGGALQTWWMHFTAPLATWRRLPAMRRVLTWAGWPLGVGGAVVLAWRLVELGLSPALVAGLTAVAGIVWAAALQLLVPMQAHLDAQESSETDGGWRLDLLHLGLSEGGGHALAQAALGAIGLLVASLAMPAGVPLVGGWTALGLDQLPALLQFGLALLVVDLGLYWQHRLLHELPALWPTHAVHHAAHTFGPTRAARHHPLSPILTTAVWAVMALLGVPVQVLVMCQAFAASNGALQHCGADLRIGRLDRVFAGPAVHRWHHAIEAAGWNRNFGPNLTVWDQVPWHRLPVLRRLLTIRHTTFYRGAEPGPDRIGLDALPVQGVGVDASVSSLRSWARQVIDPLRPLAAAALSRLSFPLIVGGVAVVAVVSTRAGLPAAIVVVGTLLSVAGLNHLLERVIPFREDWATDEAESHTDLVHLLLSGLAPHAIIAGVLALGATLTGVGLAARVGSLGLWHRVGLDALPVPFQVAAAVVLLDLCLYWHHRWMHEIPALWPIHEVHHAPETMTATRVLRNHPIGPLLTNLFVVVLGALGMDPEVFVAAQALSITVGLLQHTNADLRLGVLDHIFCGPRMHRWHHSAAEAEWDHNFGSITTLWDRVPWHLTPLRPLLRLRRTSLLLPADRVAPDALGITTPVDVAPHHTPLRRWLGHVRHPVASRRVA